MKKISPFIVSYVAILLNVCYLGLWIYAFNKYDRYEDKVSFFKKFIPFSNFELVLIALSVFSIIVFARSKMPINKVLFIVQIGFTTLFIWQFL